MKIKIMIKEISGTLINFDIIGFGNVLMDYEYGTFDSSSFDDSVEANINFEELVLINIDHIIDILTKPTLYRVQKEVDKITDIVEYAESIDIETDENRKIENWINISLPILIEAEDYERCQIIMKLKNKIEK